MNPKISYLEITARTEYPVVGLPKMHLWEPTVKTLQNQTMKDFEYIIIDVFWDERRDWFKDPEHNGGLRIKHIPANPNPWWDLGLVQTCHQFNKGLIHSDGELVLTGADSSMYPPDLMANLWRHHKDGYLTNLGFGADVTFSPELYERKLGTDGVYNEKGGGETWQGQPVSHEKSSMVPTDWYEFLGYKGMVNMDHRYKQLFEGNDRRMSLITPDWWYGISALPLKALLEINGYSQSFDGDSALNDVDVGWRLRNKGYGSRMAMFRDSYTIEAYAGAFWHPRMKLPRPEVKCNFAMMLWNKFTNKYRANDKLSESEIKEIVDMICHGHCNIQETCRTKCQHRAPFWNKNETELVDHWRKVVGDMNFNLDFERDMRINKSDYTDGTFVNCD